MAANISPAPEVERIARRLIPFHHPHLHGTRIEYVFREKAKTSGDYTTWGQAKIIRGLPAMLATPGAQSSAGLEFFVVEIAHDVWDEIQAPQREALVDHELSHCGITTDDDGNTRLAMVRHEIEEFSGVLRRHGMWKADVARFLANVGPRQLDLFTDTLDNLPDLGMFDVTQHAGVAPAPNTTVPVPVPVP